jgi:hypothetical protein
MEMPDSLAIFSKSLRPFGVRRKLDCGVSGTLRVVDGLRFQLCVCFLQPRFEFFDACLETLFSFVKDRSHVEHRMVESLHPLGLERERGGLRFQLGKKGFKHSLLVAPLKTLVDLFGGGIKVVRKSYGRMLDLRDRNENQPLGCPFVERFGTVPREFTQFLLFPIPRFSSASIIGQLLLTVDATQCIALAA